MPNPTELPPLKQFHRPAVPIALREIASWDIEGLEGDFEPSGIRASVPTLQRGLVWKPQQVEMLWDSILRGFPIGCLVVCDPLKEQENSNKSDINRHLLDGQQRCNAIALGYHDPYDDRTTMMKGESSKNILWLDLSNKTGFSAGSTRQFLTRVTTIAHPWGYRSDDSASRLEHSKIVKVLETYCPTSLENERPKRPLPRDLYPVEAEIPVPMSWLLRELFLVRTPRDSRAFWAAVADRLKNVNYPWAKTALEFLSDPASRNRMDHLFSALHAAELMQIIALSAPDNLIVATSHEDNQNGGEAPDGVSNIEHLFHRLNSQGTPLQGEELAYSMIKAYWPEIAAVVCRLQKPRVPEARLVLLGVRAALTDCDSPKVRRSVSVSALRRIAKDRNTEEYGQLAEYFLGGSDRFARAANQVESWLSTKLPPVLISSISRSSPDVYLLLLLFAEKCSSEEQDPIPELVALIPGLATYIHWFCKGSYQIEVADIIFNECRPGITVQRIQKAISIAVDGEWLPGMLPPDDVAAFLNIAPHTPFAWHYWIEHSDPEIQALRAAKWWPILGGIVWQREFLLFAQRDYLNRTFPDYDPADKNAWESHNRPWDFDHLHANAYLNNNRGDYRDFCKKWGNSIGNFRAWPFELNRSDQASTLVDKIANRPGFLEDSFVDPETVVDFSLGKEAAVDDELAIRFSKAVQTRIVKIYRHWWVNSGIKDLVSIAPLDSHASIEQE